MNGLGYFLLSAALLAIYFWFSGTTYGYTDEYNVPSENIIINPRPINCDWDYSPIGNKGCHYEKRVTNVKNYVYISWLKVEE